MMWKMCFSSSLEMIDRREMGRYSEGEDEGGEVLGMGETVECFHEEGREPEVIDWLKIRESGREIVEAVDFRRRELMPSGPGEVLSGRAEIS